MTSTDKKWVFGKVINKFFLGGLRYFMFLFCFFILIGAVLLIVLKRGDVLLALNSVSNKWLDQFFLLITIAGLGSSVAVVGVLMLFYKFRWSLLVFINLAWVGIFSNTLKRVFFYQMPRPLHYFYYDDFPRFLYDVPITYFNSFPSGHTITIYAFCSLMAFLSERRYLGAIFFLLALVVGISRIYLLQHFFIDTYFGALLGILSTILTIWLDEKFGFSKNRFLNKNLLTIVFKRS